MKTGTLACNLHRTAQNVAPCTLHLLGWKFSHPESHAPCRLYKQCVSDGGLDLDQVRGCVNGALASRLLLKNAIETDSLSPPKQWVPWVTLDGRHLGASNPSRIFLLGREVCKAYAETRLNQTFTNGTAPGLPEACATFPQLMPSPPASGEHASLPPSLPPSFSPWSNSLL
jgi:hypothetical protein